MNIGKYFMLDGYGSWSWIFRRYKTKLYIIGSIIIQFVCYNNIGIKFIRNVSITY